MARRKRIKTAYERPAAKQWVQPIRKGYRLACCDCGLTHVMDFRTVKRNSTGAVMIQFRADRDNRSTAMIRRHMKAGQKGK